MSDEEKVSGEGEEGEHEEDQEVEPEVEEEEDLETVLSVYDPDDFISGAVTTFESSLPEDLFEFEYAYGYNCHKNFNLCACDDTVVCWAAGSIITFKDVVTQQTWFRRTTTGGSVGNITSYRTDPNYRIAVAEGREGPTEPVIVIYTWPQMEMDAVLRDGTANGYSIMDFSPDGELLASVGKEPDYNLTIWTWKKHRILLRTSAFTFDVNAVFFSPYCPGQLTTAGAAHIKFWKMAQTFTGLKLKGDLGRFGKTEICDVLGVYPMPDEKVLSGCEWGNVLVWEAGLVKVEVTQRGRKRCHQAPVIQFMLSPAGYEVTTISRDGCIKAWYWDTVEQADPPEEDPYVELNPVAETCVPGCQIMCLRHQKDMYWYAQDGNGGIWTVDLELDKVVCDHKKIMTCHAGGIVGMAALRTHPILITAGEDGTLQAYSTTDHRLLAKYHFMVPIKCMLYPSRDVDESSRILLVGFADGIMRTLFLHPDRLEEVETMVDIKVSSALSVHDTEDESSVIDMISILKPHSKAITQITINAQITRLVTCGEDSTIFMYKLNPGTPFDLVRLGFVETPNNIAFMTWKPKEENVLLLCGQVGLLMEAILPDIEVRKYTEITSFKLEFLEWKETLVKKNYMRHRPFPEEDDLASLDEEALKAAGEAEREKDEDEEEWVGAIELMESDSMLGTTITWAEYCDEGVWVVQRGTGALLLVKPGIQKLLKFAPIPDAWCEDLSCLRFICEGRYLLFGTNTGYIRVARMPTEEEDNPEYHYVTWMNDMAKLLKKLKGRRLAKEELQPVPRIDFIDTYYLAMHDHYTGAVTGIEFSSDVKSMYTCGADGNIFSYKINFDEPLLSVPEEQEPPEISEIQRVPEPSTVEGEMMSHEQLKQKEEYDKMMAIANAHKKKVRGQLADLLVEYNILIKANRSLPVSQQIDVTLDPRPLEVQERELDEAKALTIRKLAHQLEASDLGLHKMYSRNIVQLDVFPFVLRAIRDPNVKIRPLRQKNLSQAFFDQLEEVHCKMAEAALRGRRAESMSRRTAARRTSWGPPRVASFLLGLPHKPPHPLKKALRNYYQRLNRHHTQFIEWQEHLFRKPDPNALPPGAAEALAEAEASIGNRLLKTDPDYVAPPGHNTQLRLCLTRKEIYDNKRVFNEKVLELRKSKVEMVAKMKKIGERLSEIRLEIPAKQAKPPPALPQIDEDLEFPENNLEVKPEAILVGPRHKAGKKPDGERKKSMLYPVHRVIAPRVAPFLPLTDTRPLAATWELLKPRPDQEASPIEVEIRDRRIERHLYEQDMLLADAEVSVQQFDARLRQLQRERIRVQENNQLLELHLYQMHQEMNVLNRFEAHEDRLAERVYSKLMQVRGVQEQIEDCEHRIEEHLEEKDQMDLSCQEMQRQFKKLVQDNKFADFLRRIFKKKYRPPRVHDDDESSEESESSSSSEEDEGSLDSRDIGPIRLDPNICPEGCDPEIYNQTFELRNNRHKFEQGMIEEDRNVEFLKKDIEAQTKVKRKLTFQLDKRKSNLREFMLEKQSCMNEVTQVVVLRYDQIRARALHGCNGPDGLSKAVVFPEQQLMKLRRRVLELQEEIRQQKMRQKINRTHLHRMNIDLRAMEATAEELRAQMRDVLTKKLGKPRKVDKTLDDLLRQMARRHKYYATMTYMPQMLQQIREWKERYSDMQKKYFSALENYSERLRKAAALQADIFPQKPMRDPFAMPGAYSPEQYQRDVVRLRIVRSQQLQHINALKDEIHQLRTKPLSELAEFVGVAEPVTKHSEIELSMIPRKIYRGKKYFPIAPLGSKGKIMYDINVMKLLFDCLDSMRVSRDDAEQLLKDLTDELPNVLTGAISRYEVVDNLVRKWLLKYGGDPALYKKQTKAFDALANLSDKLIKDHLKQLEGPTDGETQVMKSLEEALRDISVTHAQHTPLHERLAPALAALLAAADTADLETEETMASLVNSLIDEENPLTNESIDKIEMLEVITDIKACGVQMADEDIELIVAMAIDSLRAQVISPEEADIIDVEVDKALSIDHKSSISGSARTDRSRRSSKTSEYSATSKTSGETRGSAVSRTSAVSIASVVTEASVGSKASASVVTKASVMSMASVGSKTSASAVTKASVMSIASVGSKVSASAVTKASVVSKASVASKTATPKAAPSTSEVSLIPPDTEDSEAKTASRSSVSSKPSDGGAEKE